MKDKRQLLKLYKDCVEFWGIERQLRMLQEECAEVILEASHYLRPRKRRTKNLIEELADAQLMINQIKMFVGEDKVNDMIDKKSDYIKDKLENAKKKAELKWK